MCMAERMSHIAIMGTAVAHLRARHHPTEEVVMREGAEESADADTRQARMSERITRGIAKRHPNS